MKLFAVIFTLTAFLAVSPGFAADPWFVIKDANDVCKVIEAREKTPKTVAGPFKTKALAEAAKAKTCPKMQYFLIKDVNDICRVIEAETKTPKSIGGPYKTEKEAEAAKAKLCPKAKK